jgi:hypothetical protein
MTAPSGLDEIWIALRDAMLANADLRTILGAEDAIYRQWPQTNTPFPCMIFRNVQDNPTAYTEGLWRPGLQFDIYAKSEYEAQRIDAILAEAFTVPQRLEAGITTANFRLTQLQRTGGGATGVLLKHNIDNRQVFEWRTTWTARVVRKSAA